MIARALAIVAVLAGGAAADAGAGNAPLPTCACATADNAPCACAAAEDAPPPACAYAAHSLSLFAATELAPSPTVPGRVDLEAGARWHHHWLAIEARAGGGTAFTARAGGYMIGARGGVSVGAALPLASRIVITPMVAYDLFVLWQPTSGSSSPVIHQLGLATPVTVLLFRHVALEAFVEVGFARYRGTSDLAVVAGPRIAVVL